MASTDVKGLPYGAEYAKSGRAKCKDKDCEQQIEKGALRMSVRFPSSFFEGMQDSWFHFDCFWKRARRDINEGSIKGFESLKWDDQEIIRERIRMMNDAPENANDPKSNNATAEYAKSGRSTCFKCKEKISTGELRIQFRASNFHPKCLSEEGYFKKPTEEIQNFDQLNDDDKELLRTLFTGPDEDELKRRAASHDDLMTMDESKENQELEKRKEELKKQSDLLWEVKQKIEETVASKEFKQKAKDHIRDLIEANGGQPYKKASLDDLQKFLADLIVFGALEPCPECSSPLYYSENLHGYRCAAGRDEEASCSYFTREPKRKPFSSETKGLLEEYSGKILLPQGRVYPKTVEVGANDGPAVPKRERIIDPARKRKHEPLAIMKENGFAVDSAFPNADEFHVYVEDGYPLQALMHKDDPDSPTGKSFYKIQLLEEDDGDEYRIFRRWGKVETTIAKDVTTKFDSLEAAKKEFFKLFHEKSGNEFTKGFNFEDNKGKYKIVEFNTPLMGRYGVPTFECKYQDEDEAKPSKSKKIKQESDDDEAEEAKPSRAAKKKAKRVIEENEDDEIEPKKAKKEEEDDYLEDEEDYSE